MRTGESKRWSWVRKMIIIKTRVTGGLITRKVVSMKVYVNIISLKTLHIKIITLNIKYFIFLNMSFTTKPHQVVNNFLNNGVILHFVFQHFFQYLIFRLYGLLQILLSCLNVLADEATKKRKRQTREGGKTDSGSTTTEPAIVPTSNTKPKRVVWI